MKKRIILFALICLFFSGCDNKEAGKQPIQDAKQQEEQVSTRQQQLGAFAQNNQFPIFIDEFKEEIGGMLEKKGNKNIFLEQPTEHIKTDDTFGKNIDYKTSNYKINDKSDFIIYQDTENSGIYSMFCYINRNNIDEEELIEAVSCMDSVLVAFEGENAKVIADALNYYNVTENDTQISCGVANYMYSVDDSYIAFSINPL